MVINVLNVWGEVIQIIISIVVLIIFCLIFVPFSSRFRVPSPKLKDVPQPGDEIEKQPEDVEEDKIRVDDYVESFNGNAVQGKGAVPIVVTIILIGLLVWWVIYLVTNWSQYLWSVRSFLR